MDITEKQKKYMKEYRQRDYVKAKRKEYELKNKKKIGNYQKEYRKLNKEKQKKYRKNYYIQNKDDFIKKAKIYYKENKDEIFKRQKKYMKINPEKVRKWGLISYYRNKDKPKYIRQRKEYHKKNREILNKKSRERYEKNKKRYLKTKRYYNKTHPLVIKNAKMKYRNTKNGRMKNIIYCQKYRSNSEDIRFSLTPEEYFGLYERDKVCVYCGSDENLSLDHIVPVSKGGETIYDNLVVACQSCNSSKHNKNVEEWCQIKNIDMPMVIECQM